MKTMMLSATKVKLDLISDVEMYLFLEKGMRGGVSYFSKRYRKGNNKYLTSMNLKNRLNILHIWTKIIYIIMLCQNLFGPTVLSGGVLQNLTYLNMTMAVSEVPF